MRQIHVYVYIRTYTLSKPVALHSTSDREQYARNYFTSRRWRYYGFQGYVAFVLYEYSQKTFAVIDVLHLRCLCFLFYVFKLLEHKLTV